MSKYVSIGKSPIGDRMNKEEWLKFGSPNTSGVEVPQDDVEKIKEALNLLGMDLWEIGTGNFSSDVIAISPLLQEWKDKKISEREAHHQKMYEILEKAKALPKEIHVWNLGQLRVALTHSEPQYKPGHSSSLLMGLYFETTKERAEHDSIKGRVEYQFSLFSYLTDDGKVQRKKLIKDHCNLSVETIVAVIKALPEMKAKQREVASEYHTR